jgi:ribosome-binding protein aMBF1 (putative translation factor)
MFFITAPYLSIWLVSILFLSVRLYCDNDNFCGTIERIKNRKNLTMKQVADAIKVSEIAVSRWERELRIPNINNVKELAIYFGVTVGYLAGTED